MSFQWMSIEKVAEYLHLRTTDVEKLVKRDEIPCDHQGERMQFRKTEIDAWASRRIMGMEKKPLQEYHATSSAKLHDLSPGHALMPELLFPAHIEPALPAKTKPAAIRAMVALAERSQLLYDPAELRQSLLEREAMCSTALPGGIAILHPRHHDPYLFSDSLIALGRTSGPIHAGAPDGRPTDLFFLVCCQDDKIHLHILARLCTMVHGTGMLETLRAVQSAAEMCAAVQDAERAVLQAS